MRWHPGSEAEKRLPVAHMARQIIQNKLNGKEEWKKPMKHTLLQRHHCWMEAPNIEAQYACIHRKESKEMMKHPLLSGVRRVKLKDARSAFWRFHTAGVGEEGLCTIECLYFFLKALAEQVC
eukprot:scaffold150763_cov22-Tisochrysis_lutea.AAC.2